ncbi:MAG: copper transporter, partial [Marinilabiliales bacterium]
MMKENKAKQREFFGSNWAINNKTSVFVLTVILIVVGFMSYKNLPKEQFPEVVIPTIMVSTVYPGTSPEDMENLVTRQIEKQVKSISNVKKISSNSVQDYSMVVVEFETNVDVDEAKDEVKDAVDKAKPDLPSDLLDDPEVLDIDLSERPISNINISGNYDLETLKKYAEMLQEPIESLSEITRVDIVGALDREIQINLDLHKMRAAEITFSDVERAVASENTIIAIGTIEQNGVQRSISVKGQFNDLYTIENIFIQTPKGGQVYLKDIAEVKNGFKEQESYARYNGENVITLNVIKKSGENLLDASEKIDAIIADLKANSFPDDLVIEKTGDQSRFTNNTLNELNNTIIIGFILVTVVLMFFMGFSNAFFVAVSVPLAMFLSYTVLPGIDFTMNMIVMFSFIFSLGIIVDDAIVVIENTHRMHKKIPDIKKAAKLAAGEVFFPILSGTITTLAPFFPLAFWPGVVGQFMHYMPVTVIIALFASLAVAYIINPVFAVSFMKNSNLTKPVKPKLKYVLRWASFLLIPATLFHLASVPSMGNLLIMLFAMMMLYKFVLINAIYNFQTSFWPRMMDRYKNAICWVIRKRNAYWVMGSVFALFIISIFVFVLSGPKVIFFPDNDPNQINVLIKMPVGTDVKVTDSICQLVEHRVINVMGVDNPDVESIVSNVAVGADPNSFDRAVSPDKAMVTVNFVEYKYRENQHTNPYIEKIRNEVDDIPGAQITVEKNRMGPPTGKPINVEFYSEDLDLLIDDSKRFIDFINASGIEGIEELKSDLQEQKPEVIVKLDRVKANFEGVSTAQIGMALRTAIFGKEISTYKINEDEYPIMLRVAESYRENIEDIMNMNITFRDMASGRIKSIPISSMATLEYGSSYGGIRRVDNERAITISSEVISGYNANEIIQQMQAIMGDFDLNDGTTYKFTGEQENQAESMGFLSTAMMISLAIIFFTLIAQFNSIGKTLIILSEVVLSIIGVM